MSGSIKNYCWFQASIGGKSLKEKIVFELFDDITPATCANFRALCLGNEGKKVEGTNVPMSYEKSTFHRIIPGFMIQAGDFTNHNGTGGVSIYGEKFKDENFQVPCDKAGLLAMANAGPDTNGSQFFITVQPATHLTGKHVVFGKVVRGMNTVRLLEHTETGANDKPLQSCVIEACGTFDTLPEEPVRIDGDTYPDFPDDCEEKLTDAKCLELGEAIRQVGNNYFKSGDFAESVEKYSKAIRYIEKTTATSANSKVINEKLVACYNNSSMCALKLQRWNDACAAAEKVLQLEPNNAKALFRRGTANLNSGAADEAMADFGKALKNDPGNAEIIAKLQQAKEKVQEQKNKMAANFKKMFS